MSAWDVVWNDLAELLKSCRKAGEGDERLAERLSMAPWEILRKDMATLLEGCKQAGESEERLAERISNAVKDAKPISRKRLGMILRKGKAGDLSLTLAELWAIHTFLNMHQKGGFGAVLRTQPLLISVAACGKVVFILPSKRVTKSKAVIVWDLLAMMRIVEELRRLNPAIQVMTEVQQLCDPHDFKRGKSWAELFEEQPWYKKYISTSNAQAPAIICIGSPRANHATEMILATMHERPPFAPINNSETLPFRFHWKPVSQLPSTFDATESDYRRHCPTWNMLDQKECVSALIVKGNSPSVPTGFSIAYDPQQHEWSTYGIISVHRRDNGPLWIVAAGLEAPGSLGAAEALASLHPLLVDDPVSRSMTKQFFFEFVVKRKPADPSENDDTRELGEFKGLLDIP